MIDLYLKKVFSTRACWWYPDSFFHRRRPTFLLLATAGDRCVVGSFEVKSHQRQDRAKETLRLPKRQFEDEPEHECRFDCLI